MVWTKQENEERDRACIEMLDTWEKRRKWEKETERHFRSCCKAQDDGYLKLDGFKQLISEMYVLDRNRFPHQAPCYVYTDEENLRMYDDFNAVN